MSSVEDLPEHFKDTMEKRGAAPIMAIVLFGLFLFLFAIPVIGEYAKDSSIAATQEATSEGGGGGGHEH